MQQQAIVDLASKAVLVAMKVAAPSLVAIMITGLLVSIFQAATQVNEPTLSFIPKILAMSVALLATGPWILQVITSFTIELVKSIPGVTR